MFKINTQKVLAALITFFALERLSYLGFSFPLVNELMFIFLVLICLALSLYRLEYGLLMVLGELFIGSLGHLFYLDIYGLQIPLRIALWAVIMLVFIIKLRRPAIQQIRSFPYLKHFLILLALIVVALINGYLRGHSLTNIFLDFNAWLYLLLLFPLIVVYGHNDEQAKENLRLVFFAAAIWLGLKTLFLLFVFTHNLEISPLIYSWSRKNLLAEITPTLSGWPRIFIQGQIYAGLAFFLLFWKQLADFRFKQFFTKTNLLTFFLASLFLSTIIISFSRSFWVGLILTFIIALGLIIRNYSFKTAFKTLVWSLLSFIFGFIIIYGVAIFPYPSPGAFQADFLDRLSNGQEAALSSRWSLLPVLVQEIGREPFLGQGYGATVTYFSQDPRVLAKSPSGEYTTYAFEWGYLDIWLKLGTLGLAVYLLFFWRLLAASFRTKTLALGLSFGLIFLLVVNIFTPYLNHPLGLGYLLLASCFIPTNRVY